MAPTNAATTENINSRFRLWSVRQHVLAAIYAARVPVLRRQLDEQRKQAHQMCRAAHRCTNVAVLTARISFLAGRRRLCQECFDALRRMMGDGIEETIA